MNPARSTTAVTATAVVLATAGTLLIAVAPAAAAPARCASPVFTREFFANTTFSGAPRKTDCDSAVDEDWRAGAPASGLPKDKFGVRWSVTRDFGSGGPFTFRVGARDGVRVHLDGVRKVDLWSDVSGTRKKTVNVTVPRGKHTLRVDFVNWTGNADVDFTYAPRTSATVDRVKPLVPGGLSAAYDRATGRTKLTWAKNREMDLAGYRVYRRVTGASPSTRPLATTTSTSFTDTAVPPTGDTYLYEVRAHDKAGNRSARSAPVKVRTEDRTAPSAVTGLKVRPTGYGFALKWDRSGASDAKTYVVHWGEPLGDGEERVCYGDAVEYLGVGTTSHDYLTLPDGDETCFFVDVLDAAGNSSLRQTGSAHVVTATEHDTTPGVPTPEGSPLTVTARGAEGAEGNSVRWTGLGPSAPQAARGYRVHRWNPATAAYEKIADVGRGGSSYVDTGAGRGTTSYYWVTAVAADGTESVPAGDWAVSAPAAR
ncbi:fibronectin type III domain-containing protein [Streptomyces sp. JNUCC 64]